MNQTTKPYRIMWSVAGATEDFSDVILLTREQAAEVEKRVTEAEAKSVIFGFEIYELENGVNTWDDLLPCLDGLSELADDSEE